MTHALLHLKLQCRHGQAECIQALSLSLPHSTVLKVVPRVRIVRDNCARWYASVTTGRVIFRCCSVSDRFTGKSPTSRVFSETCEGLRTVLTVD